MSFLGSNLIGSSEPIIDTPESLPKEISRDEAVRLGAVDTEFFNRVFFPKTFRQDSPAFAKELTRVLEDPSIRMAMILMFRGSAKTTRLRSFLAKRIAYGISRTVLFIGASEPDAGRSIQWLRGQIERNTTYTSTFGLRPGKKWQETTVEIENTILGQTSWVLGVGVTSSLRGINFDDYRPDLIILDDVLTDENVLTLESREKINGLILGAVAQSLTPRSEEPNAKLVMLQTPLHQEDTTALAAKSKLWTTIRFGCWTKETEDLPDSQRISAWPSRFPSEELLKEKQDYLNFGKLSVFLREKECKVVSAETASFKVDRLNYYNEETPLRRGVSVLAVDPVPPPSEREIAKNLIGKDYEALVVMTRIGGDYYLRHYEQYKGHDPSWTLAKIFELAHMFQVSYISVDSIAYQAVLRWLLENEMKRRGIYYSVIPDKGAGKKSKYQKILDSINPLLMYKKLYVKQSHTEFISDLTLYPSLPHDDLLDAVSIALRALINPTLELGETEYSVVDETEIKPLHFRRRAP